MPDIHANWQAVPRDHDVLFRGVVPNPQPESTESLPVPATQLALAVKDFAKTHLDPKTFNHSARVYHYGLAIAKSAFPDWIIDTETWYATAMLHDIGLAGAYHLSTNMSFEFKGGIVARDFLLQNGAPETQADSVCEAIILHQDIWVKGGNISLNGQLIILATLHDNAGHHASSVHRDTIKAVVKSFPRNGWSEAFACAVEAEMRAKPWSHTTTFEKPNWRQGVRGSQFGDTARSNELMREFD